MRSKHDYIELLRSNKTKRKCQAMIYGQSNKTNYKSI